MAKGGLARERFRLKQQQNRIVSQLNQLKEEGFSQDQIRAAGNNAYRTLAGSNPSQVVVADGDTLATIAEQNGTTEQDILQANPELNAVQTGMILNAPRPPALPGSPEWRDKGGVGLPSNAVLGSTTTNRNGYQGGQISMWAGTTPGYNQQQKPNPALNSGMGVASNPYAGYQYRPPTPSGGFSVPGGLSEQQRSQITSNPLRTATPLQPPQAPTANPARPSTLPSTYPGGFRRWAGQEMEQINSPDYTPNEMTLKVLEKAGLIKKTPALSGGYGGGGYTPYKKGRGGGRGRGGGGGGMQPRAQQGERLPAFSNGGGFGGLINWRI